MTGLSAPTGCGSRPPRSAARLPGGSSCAGRWAPDLPGLRELARTGRPLLLDPTGTLSAGPWAQRVDVVAAPQGLDTALLLRPDCYVAWQGTTSDGLDEALTRWSGKP
jgi:hypothetical protein